MELLRVSWMDVETTESETFFCRSTFSTVNKAENKPRTALKDALEFKEGPPATTIDVCIERDSVAADREEERLSDHLCD